MYQIECKTLQIQAYLKLEILIEKENGAYD